MARDGDIYWTRYTLPTGQQVYLTKRPDWCNKESVTTFVDLVKPLMRISICDDWVEPVSFDEKWAWYPWDVARPVPAENIFAFLATMKRLVVSENRAIWIHCDFSSYRAPTFFGLFVRAFYPEKVTEVCNNIEVSSNNGGEGNYQLKYHSNPADYSLGEVRRGSEAWHITRTWRDGGEKAAYQFYMQLTTGEKKSVRNINIPTKQRKEYEEVLRHYKGNWNGTYGTHWKENTLIYEDKFGSGYDANGKEAKDVLDKWGAQDVAGD